MRLQLKLRLMQLLLSDLSAISVTLAFAGLVGFAGLASIALKSAPGLNSNIRMLEFIAPTWAWAILFLVYGLLRLHRALFRYNSILTCIIPIIGIWLFIFLLIGGLMAVPRAGIPQLYIVPVVLEVWIMVKELYLRSYSGRCRERYDVNGMLVQEPNI